MSQVCVTLAFPGDATKSCAVPMSFKTASAGDLASIPEDDSYMSDDDSYVSEDASAWLVEQAEAES